MAKILVLGKYYPPFSGGIEVNTRDVSEKLAQTDDVTVLCFNHFKGTTTEVINGVKIKRYEPFVTLKSQPLSFGIFFQILTTPADIVHFHAPNFVANAALFFKMISGGVPRLIITHHTDIFGRTFLKNLLMPMYKYALKKSDFVIVTSRKLVEISDELIDGPNYQVIPLGVDPQKFQRRAEPDTGLKPVGFLGRHARYKGLSVLMNALHGVKDVRARIAGDGPYRQEAEDMVEHLDLTGRALFLGDIGNMPDKIAFYQSIGIFVFPSTETTETFGICQIEAMLMGVPVIASNLPTGVTDVAIHEETALLVEPNDPVQLAAAIVRLQEDAELRQRLVDNARAHVLKNFTHDLVVGKTVALFKEALSGMGHHAG